jgi:hypothetical protein
VRHGVTDSCLSAFRIDIAAMLQENASLESLCIESIDTTIIAENYVEFVTALQHNRTLQKLMLNNDCGALELNDNEDKRMARILKKNYALESLPDIDLESRPGDVGAILRLNAAGRRYLIQDGSSVLISVRGDTNCVFLHLLENPRLCNRSVVEPTSDSTEEGRGSANPENMLESESTVRHSMRAKNLAEDGYDEKRPGILIGAYEDKIGIDYVCS